MHTKLHRSVHPEAQYELPVPSVVAKKPKDVLPCHASVLLCGVCDMAYVFLASQQSRSARTSHRRVGLQAPVLLVS